MASKQAPKTKKKTPVAKSKSVTKPTAAKKKAPGKNSKKGAALEENNKKKSGKAAKTQKPKLVDKKVAAEIMRLLCLEYPDADCELIYKNDFELLISVILSAQTTDVQVNKVTPKLFARFPTAEALAGANLDEVKELIKATGYYNNKAKSIQSCAHALLEKFKGKVPNNLEDLTQLPGVGRKTANVVLGVIHKIPGWTVDTHVQRLSGRFGFTSQTDPYKIELDLQKLFPESDWTKYSITIIWHGRRLCYARNPDCTACPVNHLCPSSLAP